VYDRSNTPAYAVKAYVKMLNSQVIAKKLSNIKLKMYLLQLPSPVPGKVRYQDLLKIGGLHATAFLSRNLNDSVATRTREH